MNSKQIKSKLRKVKAKTQKKFASLRGKVMKSSKRTARSAIAYTKKKPLATLGIFAFILTFFGFVIGRKSKR